MKKALNQPHFAIRRARPGLGHGLFASKLYRKGGFVVEYTGRRISSAHADMLKTRYLFEVSRRWTIDGSPRSNIARYANHSCNPNCEAELRCGRVFLYAKRAIRKGEELTFNYGEEYFDEFIKPQGCKCTKCAKQ